ncbi:MAG: RnfABCDGE type electron transport complex subunit D [Clostridia bacterium]|nr:RnfABCDGE type electron transport complex subunit D [Clostridia bacterium]
MTELKNKLTVSASPHVRSKATTQGIMLDVIIALCPALIASGVLFGLRAIAVSAVCVGVCVISEYVARKVMKRSNTIADLSAVVTGLLLAFNLPSGVPLWIAAIGSVAAIVIIKQFFGGIGQNFINPALGARIILLTSFPSEMAKWEAPLSWKTQVVTTASPLASMYNESKQFTTENLPSLTDMLLGNRAGCLGEVCAAALILGGLYLIIRKVISPVIPLTFIGTVGVFMAIKSGFDMTFVLYQLLSGGLLLGAIFMATDYTTSPISFKGKIIYGIGCGLIASLIRCFGNLPEGVSFAIVLMNILVPHIENLTTPKPFGSVKEKKEKKVKEDKAS